MTIRSLGRSRCLVYAVLAAFAVFTAPVGLSARGPAPFPAADSGSLSGFIYAKDVKTPVAGAVVKIRNVADMKEMTSLPTDANGMYTIIGIPEGRYLLGVSAAKEDFNLDYALFVKAGELGKLSVALAAGGEAGQQAGEASLKKKGFFNSVAGRVLVVAAIGVGLYFLIVPQGETSPIR
jgi:hypothetical protein